MFFLECAKRDWDGVQIYPNEANWPLMDVFFNHSQMFAMLWDEKFLQYGLVKGLEVIDRKVDKFRKILRMKVAMIVAMESKKIRN